jgi:hypothetical protein
LTFIQGDGNRVNRQGLAVIPVTADLAGEPMRRW